MSPRLVGIKSMSLNSSETQLAVSGIIPHKLVSTGENEYIYKQANFEGSSRVRDEITNFSKGVEPGKMKKKAKATFIFKHH